MRKIMYTLLIMGILALTACAVGKPPFMSDSDWVIKEKLVAELAEYKDLRISVSGGRVYLEGAVPNVPDRNRVFAAAKATEGVHSVMESLYLTQVGSDGPSDPFD